MRPADDHLGEATGGTSMPSYHLVLENAELWDLSYYVESLGGPLETTDDERAGWHIVQHHQRRRR